MLSDLLFSFNAVAPLFGVMLLGYALAQKKFFSPEFIRILNRFCFTVTLPAMLFNSTYNAVLSEIFNPGLILTGVVSIFLIIALLCLVIPAFIKNRARASAMIQGAYRSNVALFGLSLTANLFGAEGIGPATMLLTFIIPTFNISAVILLQAFAGSSQNKTSWKSMVKGICQNGLIIGSVLGILLSAAHIQLPTFLEKTVNDVASMATPLAMMSLGAQFDVRRALANVKYNLITCSVKLVAIPLVMTAVCVWLGFRGAELAALYVLYATPASTSSYIMASTMGSDGELAGQIVVSTTFLSVFTIFIGVYLLKSLGLI